MTQENTFQKPSNQAAKLKATNREAQQKRLLAALIQAGSKGINTIQAREELNVLHPGGRIYELRHNLGKNIKTIWTTEMNGAGYPHRVARYVLFPGDKGAA